MLDKINKKILSILQDDGSITNSDLAGEVGLAPATTLERVKKLEKQGYIRRYTAIVEPEKVGKGIIAFVSLTVKQHSVESIKEFKANIVDLPEVLSCYRIAGDKDYLLKIVCKDIKSFEAFSTERLAAVPGIARLSTTFVLSTVKEETKIHLD